MEFEDLGLIEPLLRAVRFEGYIHPTPIQETAIPHVLAGKDLMGCAQTGTGKTAAFALPILQRLHEHARQAGHRPIRSLILTPTRELAAQIGESFVAYGRHSGLHCTTVYGGVRQGPQVAALKKGVDILVATPGRLMDLMGQGYITLSEIKVLVLDEADRMLDMGFIQDIRRIVAQLPRQRQTLMFSATMPKAILGLARDILHQPVEIRVKPEAPAAEGVHHAVFLVERHHKQALLQHLLSDPRITRALVFTRTKHGADRVARNLRNAAIQAEAIHSNKAQNARQRTLENFKNGRTRVLVASDIVSRGIDVDGISHVINFDVPSEPELYVHRIGRTARAGHKGMAMSFCAIEERIHLDDIEQLIRMPLEHVTDHPFPSPLPRLARKAAEPPKPTWRNIRRLGTSRLRRR